MGLPPSSALLYRLQLNLVKRWRLSRSLILRGVAVLALLVLLVALLTRDDDGGSSEDEPEIVTAAQLSEFAADADRPVYWVGGAKEGVEYELKEAPEGDVHVRYVEEGTEPGEGTFLTVVTYPAADGVAALERSADSRKDLELGRTDNGAALLIDPESPKNANLAYPDEDVHIEVFSPVPGEALRLAVGDEVEPVP